MELVREFDRRGLTVILATIGPRLTDEQQSEIAALRHVLHSEHVCRLRWDWTDEAWQDVDEAGQWLLELARVHEPDLVQVSDMSHGALPWRVPSVIVAHSCVLGRWEAVHGAPTPPSLEVYRRRMREGLAAADLIVTPTGAMLDALERICGRLPNAQVIWNARARDAFRAGPKTYSVLGLGRVWDPAKNLDALDRAAGGLSWPVAIAGEIRDPHGEAVRLAHAQWLGVLAPSELAAALASASIFCLPARYEPSGIAITEAALSGCALVLGDLPGLRELWSDAALFVPNDDEALRSALQWTISHPSARERLAAQAYAVAQAWTPATMAATYLARYRSACAALVA
jgi:glycosyltransferase involved in cell wall biosynthesis